MSDNMEKEAAAGAASGGGGGGGGGGAPTGTGTGAVDEEEPDDDTAPQPPSLLGCCLACFCCMLCTPCLVLCCCCAGADTAINKAQGKRWDGKQNRWVVDNLVDEEAALRTVPADDDDILKLAAEEAKKDEGTTADGAGAAAAAASSSVKETAYYDALGVPPDADEKKIKRAYYIQARKWHPDKNDSAEAKEKFQKIGEAYQVLSDDKLRAVYDKEGEAGLSGDRTEVAMEKLDPALVFTFLFGSDAFSDIVGRLQLVTQTMAGDPAETKIGAREMDELERRRVVRLALKLRDRIQTFVAGNEEAAKTEWTAEAERLVEVRYGEELLNTVGRTYVLVATQAVGTWGEGMEARMGEHEMKRDAAMAAYHGAQTMGGGDGGGGGDNGADEDHLPTYVELMWNVTVIDITTTLREVVMKLVCDKSCDSATRKKRAAAIIALGEIWVAQKSKNMDEHRRSVRGLYQSAAAAAMEETLNKMREKEEG